MKRTLRTLVALSVMVTTLSAFTCTKNELLSNAGLAADSLRAAIPLIEQFLPGSSEKLQSIIPIAQKVKDAIAANDATNAVEFLRQLLPVFDDIIQHDVHGLPTGTQTKILAALALADIGFSFIANFYVQHPVLVAVAPSRDRGGDPIAAFARRPVWGRDFKK